MRIPENHWLITKPVAHRGLWGGNVIENSLSAYKNAVKNGYPIEIDVHLTKDGHLVSFHDDTLVRMTGVEGKICEKTLQELKQLRLNGTDQTIPTFDELLEVVDGKVPLLIEIKPQKDKKIVEKLIDTLMSYKGEYALQSFNHAYILKVKKLAPHIIRGVLADPKNKIKNLFYRFVVGKMPLNWLIKPDFISVKSNAVPLSQKIIKNSKVICWTITDQDSADMVKPYVDNIIFEHFIPKNW